MVLIHNGAQIKSVDEFLECISKTPRIIFDTTGVVVEMKIPNNDELIDTICSIYQNIEQRLAPVITKHADEVERLYPNPTPIYEKVDIDQNFIRPPLLKPEDMQANEEALEELAVVVKNNPDYPMFWSALYVTLSEFFKRTGDLESYHAALSDSIIHSIHTKQYDEVEIFAEQLAQLHKSQGKLDHYKNELESLLLINDTDNKQNTNIPQLYAHYGLAGVYKVTQNKTEHLRHLGNTLYVMQGPIDYEAYNIAQHEVGFAQKQKIGTDNLQQCVALIVYDPTSKNTAFAHIDRFTDPSSLVEDVINPIDPQHNKSLIAYLIGGRDTSQQQVGITKSNILKTLGVLKNITSNIHIQDNVLNNNTPQAIVFDPITNVVVDHVPGKKDDTIMFRKARLNLVPCADNTSRLNVAFNFITPRSHQNQISFTEDEYRSLITRCWDVLGQLNNYQYKRWFFNIVYEPLEEVVTHVMSTKPELFKATLTTYTRDNNIGLFDDDNKRDHFINSLDNILNNSQPLTVIHKKWYNTILNLKTMAVPNVDLNQHDKIASNTLQTIPNQTHSNNLVQYMDLDSIQFSQHDRILLSNIVQQLSKHTEVIPQERNAQAINFNPSQQYKGTDLSQVLRSVRDSQQSVVQPCKMLPSISTLFQSSGMEHRVIKQSNSPQSSDQPLSKRSKKNEQSRD